MAVRRDGRCARKGIALFHGDLVADSTASRVKINALGVRKRLDIRILGQVLGRFVLHVVKTACLGKLCLRRPDRFEPNYNQTKKNVMTHDNTGPVISNCARPPIPHLFCLRPFRLGDRRCASERAFFITVWGTWRWSTTVARRRLGSRVADTRNRGI
jgi:hypothetical protein